jgi:cysteinyl-tRNA synthetase
MNLYLHNTLTKSKELFTPINPDMVGIYSCGPTVYGEPHIGNMRKYFIDDLLKNVIKYVLWLPTTHVVNITDVGHLTGENEWDADHGEDKMEKWARRDGITAWDVAKKYEALFHENCRLLKLDPFDVTPRATEHIAEQIEMVQQLEAKWYTYVIDGDGIYMDTSKVENYGVLVWQKHLDWLVGWARVDLGWRKNHTDFALWKFNMTGLKRDMERDSPWWVGFPWWHIECSAMSIKYLWKHFDIHTWGIDHIPVHHTNEIAQSQCSCSEKPRVNYWLHYQFLNIGWERIAKSVGNVVTIADVIDKWYKVEDLRMFYLQNHYRSFQDFTWEWLESAKAMRQNLIKKFSQYQIIEKEPDLELIDFLKEQLCDDLNTAGMIGRLFASFDVMDDEIATAIKWLDDHVLKLWLFDPIEKVEAPAEIQALADQRRQAKLNKDYTKADEIRSQLTALWWSMLDGKDWYTLEKI